MAKGNYKSVIAGAAPVQNDISSWIVQQEQMNLQQKQYLDKKRTDADKKVEDQRKAFAEELKEVGYGKRAELNMTGDQATDYHLRMVGEQMSDMWWERDKELTAGYAERGSLLDPFTKARLMSEKAQIELIPQKVGMALKKWPELMTKLQEMVPDGKGGEKNKYIITPEQLKIMQHVVDGNFIWHIDKKNPGNLMIVTDFDGDGNFDDFFPIEHVHKMLALGDLVPNIDMGESAAAFGKGLGTYESVTEKGLMKITEKGVKYDKDQITQMVRNEAAINPSHANSFAYQFYGKAYNQLEEEQRDEITRLYTDRVISKLNETYKEEFNAPKANYGVSVERLNETKRHNKETEQAARDRINLELKKWESKNPDSNVFSSTVPFYEDKVITDSKGRKKTERVQTEMNLPIYAVKDYEIETEDGKRVKVNTVEAFPKSDGTIDLWASDGTGRHLLNESEKIKIRSLGISEERIKSDFNKANGIQNNNNTTESSESSINDPLGLGL